jgi:hypothetical protein
MTDEQRLTIKHCTCAFYDSDGTPVPASAPCVYHPAGSLCEHGKGPDEPCMPCRDELWGRTS